MKKFRLKLNVLIEPQDYSGGERLTIQEDITIEQKDFMEMCLILGRFVDLAKQVRG